MVSRWNHMFWSLSKYQLIKNTRRGCLPSAPPAAETFLLRADRTAQCDKRPDRNSAGREDQCHHLDHHGCNVHNRASYPGVTGYHQEDQVYQTKIWRY